MVLVRLVGPVDVVDESGAVRPIGSAVPARLQCRIGHYKECLDVARQCGDVLSVGDGLRAVAMCEVGLRPTDSIALALASGGHVEAASVIVGYLQAHHRPYGIECELGFPEQIVDHMVRLV